MNRMVSLDVELGTDHESDGFCRWSKARFTDQMVFFWVGSSRVTNRTVLLGVELNP